MRTRESLAELAALCRGILHLNPDRTLTVNDAPRLRSQALDELAATAVFAADVSVREAARWLIRECAHALGAHPASIQGLYEARGRGKWTGLTVPAVNLRGLTYDSARALFRAAQALEMGPFVFELARSETGYTDQRPGEYAACVMAAAIKERWHGPVFLQGDHYQFSAKGYAADPDGETRAVRELVLEAIASGHYNIDIDASTLVDLSQPTLDEQQKTNYTLTAELTGWIREHEPRGVTVSVGGEIGEVGHKNSTVEELRAYLDGYRRELEARGDGLAGISKVSVQTGTSHGGVPTAEGKVAEVKLDFRVLADLSRVAREDYGMAGAVQHGASTLPDELFHKFPEVDTAEIHLATGFQNLLMDGGFLPEELRREMFAWCAESCAGERKEGQTEEQFLYKTRKKTYGPFKRQLWSMPGESLARYTQALEGKFRFLFEKLGCRGSHPLLERHVHPVLVHQPVPPGLGEALRG